MLVLPQLRQCIHNLTVLWCCERLHVGRHTQHTLVVRQQQEPVGGEGMEPHHLEGRPGQEKGVAHHSQVGAGGWQWKVITSLVPYSCVGGCGASTRLILCTNGTQVECQQCNISKALHFG